MKFYKLVSKKDDRLFSWFMKLPELVVEYIPGKWVRGKFPLFVLNDLEIATNHCNPKLDELWECEVENPRRKKGVAFAQDTYEEFWADYNTAEDLDPENTTVYIADRVKLTNRIM